MRASVKDWYGIAYQIVCGCGWSDWRSAEVHADKAAAEHRGFCDGTPS